MLFCNNGHPVATQVLMHSNPFDFSFMSRVWVSALLEAKILHEAEWGYLSRPFSPVEQQQQMVDSRRVRATRETTVSCHNDNDGVQGFSADGAWPGCNPIKYSADRTKHLKKYYSREN